jgi:Kef-type K+ transport system membrane component KefB
MSWHGSSALGILMNTRGLMELIVLNIGYDLRIISPTLFAMMVLMALVTTIATTPLLQMLHHHIAKESKKSEVHELEVAAMRDRTED